MKLVYHLNIVFLLLSLLTIDGVKHDFDESEVS